MRNNESIIQNLLEKLKKKEGYFIFIIEDFNILFSHGKSKIYVQAYSNFSFDIKKEESISNKFYILGYNRLDVESNYYKRYSTLETENILNDIKKIYSNIYGVDFSKKATIINQIQDTDVNKTKKNSVEVSDYLKNNWWKYVLIVTSIIFFIYKLGSSSKSNNENSSEIVSNSVTKNEAFIISKKIIEKQIVDVKIEDFGNVYESQIKDLGNNTFLIKNYFYIKSNNNIMMRRNYMIELKYISGDWTNRINWSVIDFYTQ